MIFADKIITVKEYTPKALVFNGWVKIDGRALKINNIEDIKKGISNYEVKSEEQLDKLLSLNETFRCECFDNFLPSKPISFDRIGYVSIDSDEKYDYFSKCDFNKIQRLSFNGISIEKIEVIFKKIKKVGLIRLNSMQISAFDFRKMRIESFAFNSIDFKGKVFLPKSIKELYFADSNNFDQVSIQNVNELRLSHKESLSAKDMLSLKGAKAIRECYIGHHDFTTPWHKALPPGLRVFWGQRSWLSSDFDPEQIRKDFPYLIRIQQDEFPIQIAQKLNLRDIDPKMEATSEKFAFRPVKIRLTAENISELNKHPELFEKVRSTMIDQSEFNLDCLAENMEKLTICSSIDTESKGLNRL